jgi:hypothetical protein
MSISDIVEALLAMLKHVCGTNVDWANKMNFIYIPTRYKILAPFLLQMILNYYTNYN